MARRRHWSGILLLAAVALICTDPTRADERPPNVIVILADDLGMAELGCTGSERIRTPNLDRLAARGMLFSRAYSGSTVCAPSRCTLLTGLHTGHAQIRDNGEVPNFSGRPGAPGTEEIGAWREPPEPDGMWGGQRGLLAGTETIARVLQRAGYATCGVGKWGLGGPGSDGVPTKQGFDTWLGYLCQRNAHNYYPRYLVRDEERLTLEGNDRGLTGAHYATDLMLEHALGFIRDNTERPFFLYYATPVPHLALQVPDDSLAEYTARWSADDDQPYEGGKGYLPHPRPRAAYAAMVTRFDRNMGRLFDELENLGIADETVIFMTSDNGSTFALGGYDPQFFQGTGGLRGHKTNLYEGGIRVPFIAAWPGRIGAGSTSDTIVANWDLFPTIAALTGAAPDAPTDGIDLTPVLLGTGEAPERDHLYWEFHSGGGWQVVRRGKWKAIRRGFKKDPDAAIALYDLDADPTETTDLAGHHPDVVEAMAAIMRREHTPSPVQRWNIAGPSASGTSPNVVIIFADDLGYGDVGVFGAEPSVTPNVDRMATEGMRFTDFYVAQPVCSASRAALLTGCYPNRLGITGALGPGAKRGLHPDETTLAELCKTRGYATGVFGKWHLGH
ncbi:MAG: arylsulfatase, partial [Planctomycetota bacterium]